MMKKVQEQIEQLEHDVLSMGIYASTMILDVFKAMSGNKSIDMEAMHKNDQALHDHERKIEAKCISLLVEESLFGTNFRQVSAILKIISDLERIGHQAMHMAEIIDQNKFSFLFQEPTYEDLAKQTTKMVIDAMLAYKNKDRTLASQVIENDERVDRCFDQVKQNLIQHKKVDQQEIVNGILLAKYLERISDHAAHICMNRTDF